MENKNRLIKTIAIISALVLMVLTVLPGCNFVGKSGKNGEDVTGVNESVEDQLCCPVCSSTDVGDPDGDGVYTCNSCNAQWRFVDDKLEMLDEKGNVIDTLDKSAGYVSGNTDVEDDTTATDNNVTGSGSGSSGSGSSGSGSGYSGGGSGSGGSGSGSGSGSSDHTGYVTYTTNKNTSKQVKENLEKIRQAGKNLDDSIEIIYDEETQSYTVKSKNGKDTGLFGYKYSTKDKIFYTAEDSWQRNFGFTEVYDDAAALGLMTYNTMRVRFDYGGQEWMLQFWKGQYGYAFIGAEVGVYTRPAGSDNGTYYDCANDNDKLFMTMDVYRQNPQNNNKYDHLFTRSRSKTWWCTGFIPGTLGFAQYNVPDQGGTSKLKADVRIEFKDNEMAQAFMNSLSQITTMENNSALSGTNRAVHFYQLANESEYNASSASCKYVLCEDGKTVRVCYR